MHQLFEGIFVVTSKLFPYNIITGTPRVLIFSFSSQFTLTITIVVPAFSSRKKHPRLKNVAEKVQCGKMIEGRRAVCKCKVRYHIPNEIVAIIGVACCKKEKTSFPWQAKRRSRIATKNVRAQTKKREEKKKVNENT